MAKVLLGRIVNTFGIKGEAKILSFTDFGAQRYEQGKAVFIRKDPKGTFLRLEVESYRTVKGLDLVKFAGYDSMNAVEQYIGFEVFAEQDDVSLPEGHHHYADLIGCSVYDEHDTLLGEVLSVENFGPHDNLRIRRTDGKSLLVPFVSDFINNVDTDKRKIVINVIEGLL